MRLFLSYRRDDTSGRAGRLSDSLRQRLGASNVFQDVASISPGVDFERAIDASLARTDATIVVIGPEWTSLRGPDGTRRLDQPDDYVRREVAAALASDRPVVPVLVGDARVLEPEELPTELRPLLKRQAIALRDVAWNEDVDGLVRALRADIDPNPSRRRRAAFVAGGAAAVVVVGIVLALWLWSRGGDSPSEGAADTPPCSAVDGPSVSGLSLGSHPVGTYELADGTNRRIGYTATALRVQDRNGTWRVLVDVDVSNQTTAVEGTTDDNWYIDPGDFQHVVVDGVEGGEAACFNLLSGARNVPPHGRAAVRVGFDSPADPRRSELALVTGGTPIPLAVGQT
jgi:hypothetical protein